MKLPAKHIPRDTIGILREIILLSFFILLFAFLVSWKEPVKWIAFIPLSCAALIMGRQLSFANLFRSGLFRFDYNKLLYAAAGVLMGIAGAMYYRGIYAMPLLPANYRGFVLLAVCIGTMEELVFRGYFYGRLQHLHPVIAITGAALIHAAYKAALFLSPVTAGITPIWLFFSWSAGAFLLIGLLRYLSNSIWPPILAHAVFDLLVYAENAEAPVWVW
jgi:membrane protease YdiL (CAAX protease family)